ncbi:MAG: choice-of-anchor A family protein [Nostoc sp. ZfuVER08]|jgi:choice-of-anchor A domain-containing protein|uniref:Choice-of-anchor A family protein n=1 Tax=Nostoc punctiforme FACHB-252 TaxID=1357509 RepID=A0ABR8H2L1_NOSPU|nr:choice-of-anchor A family protein [Nostoc punctiforme]MBD2610037.1 choice-of-anchor A family protein [Nostoc punctiforme FACHB-252]MBL1200023.1 choice-of-anchor A family protein [Nostoc sp. GBBB01]MDZ8013677.1 choice-of-anchor A family protein [Nostoc sp. ZfuVER08]
MKSKTYYVWQRVAVPIAVTLALGISAKANAVELGAASDYNVFVLGDITQKYTDIEGKLAAGGNVNFVGGLGSRLANNSGNVVVAGQNLTLSNGQVYHGNAVYGGTANVSSNVGFPQGTLSKGNPIDFNAAGEELRSLSQYLATLTPTGNTTVQPWGAINLSGTGTAFNVFNLSGTDVSKTNYFEIKGDANSTILVNISGKDVSLQNFGFNILGTDKQKVIYNFYEATNLTASSIGIQGSILAPLANFNFNNGQVNGNVVVASLTGNGESHNYLFNGDLPSVPKTETYYNPPNTTNNNNPTTPTSVPEPANLPGLGLIALGFGIFRHKRYQTTCLK